jgi:hypothetical protein
MVEIADILRRHGPAYLAKYGDRMLPSHKKAIQAMLQCRSESRSHYVKQKFENIIYFGYYAFLFVPGRYFHHKKFYFSTWQREFLNANWPNI